MTLHGVVFAWLSKIGRQEEDLCYQSRDLSVSRRRARGKGLIQVPQIRFGVKRSPGPQSKTRHYSDWQCLLLRIRDWSASSESRRPMVGIQGMIDSGRVAL